MLDYISIFTKTGIVLWSKNFCKLINNPVDEFISNILMEEKGSLLHATIGNYSLRWVSDNSYDIIFVAIYSKLLTLLYIEDLLDKMKKTFITEYESSLKSPSFVSCNFDARFDKLLVEAETKCMQQKRIKNTSSTNLLVDKDNTSENFFGNGNDNIDSGNSDGDGSPSQVEINAEAKDSNEEKDVHEILQSKGYVKKGGMNPPKKHIGKMTETQTTTNKKEKRVWGGGSDGKISAKEAALLDRSKSTAGDKNEDDNETAMKIYMPDTGEKPMWEIEQEESEEFENTYLKQNDVNTNKTPNWGKSYIGSLIQTITGGKIIDEDDLGPVLTKMEEMLQERNVALEIAKDICASVGKSLIGQKLASFTRINTVVANAMRDAIQRIITPRSSTDVLRQILDAKAEGKVFSAVFVGINGVGKSTSLAKVAYYLKEQGVKVLIAACDTFRSGAVEQLRTHSRCLEIPLFQMGYTPDPSRVAAAALQHAQENKFDCVLIDTAGRMQNNEPLMRALAKLVADNNPNLVLFVGEALVGNDGVDQLSMFDRALINYSPPGKIHKIDGIILTKYDTVDEKVGAALSMSYKTGQPILFVGTGQKYTHLKKLSVPSVVKHLIL